MLAFLLICGCSYFFISNIFWKILLELNIIFIIIIICPWNIILICLLCLGFILLSLCLDSSMSFLGIFLLTLLILIRLFLYFWHISNIVLLLGEFFCLLSLLLYCLDIMFILNNLAFKLLYFLLLFFFFLF